MKKRDVRNRKFQQKQLPHPPSEQLSSLFDLPQSALPGMPQIELSGNREALVEGCQGILEYDEGIIKLSAGKMSIKFTGRDLQIRVLTRDSAIVDGFITNIEFLI